MKSRGKCFSKLDLKKHLYVERYKNRGERWKWELDLLSLRGWFQKPGHCLESSDHFLNKTESGWWTGDHREVKCPAGDHGTHSASQGNHLCKLRVWDGKVFWSQVRIPGLPKKLIQGPLKGPRQKVLERSRCPGGVCCVSRALQEHGTAHAMLKDVLQTHGLSSDFNKA